MNRLVVLTPALLLFILSSAQAQTQPQPTWHGMDGQELLAGRLLSANGVSVQIVKDDGTFAKLNLEDLSIADRAVALTRDKKDSEFQRPIRTWTSVGGTHHVDAKVILFDDTTARLARTNVKLVVNVPLSKLSKDDTAYLDRIKKLLAESEPDPFTPTAGSTFAISPPPTGTTRVSKSPAPSASSLPPDQSSTALPTTKGTVDRNPYNETQTGQTATGIPTFTGPRGGQYHYSASGKKVYEKH